MVYDHAGVPAAARKLLSAKGFGVACEAGTSGEAFALALLLDSPHTEAAHVSRR